MDRASTEEEKAALINKFFDCTEAPIKEWLADFTKIDVRKLFDYADINDVIGFEHESEYYTAYVVTMDAGSPSMVDPELLKKSEKARKACSMLFDAVQKVFSAVTSTVAENYKDPVQDVVPMFVEEKMAFHLWRINRKAMQLQAASEQNNSIRNYLENTKEELSPENKEALQNTMKVIKKVFEENTQAVLEEQEVICKALNERIKSYTWLHIVIEKSDENKTEHISESMKRLPTFGIPFHDPEEETLIERLKREHQ